MQSSSSPLTIHNCTNDEMICRYVRQGRMDRAQVTIGPRGNKLIQDAYLGMKIYASTSYDPSSAVPFHLQQHVDEIFFTHDGAGYGKGAPVGPPPSARDTTASKHIEVAKEKLNNAGRDDVRGASLSFAHSSDLTKQGFSGGELSSAVSGGGDEKIEDSRVWVPGMGWMDRSAIPKHVLDQLAMRQAAHRDQQTSHDTEEAPPYPHYESLGEKNPMHAMKLPPLRLTPQEQPLDYRQLTWPEQYISAKYHQYMQWPTRRCDKYARGTFIALVCGAFYLYYSRYRGKYQSLRRK